MKTKIVIGCIFSAFLILITPAISAVQYQNVEEIREMNQNELMNNLRLTIQRGRFFIDNATVLLLRIIEFAFLTVLYALITTLYIFDYRTEVTSTPNISFVMDQENATLTVEKIDRHRVPWDDISIVGMCNTTGFGKYVDVGDVITECCGVINISYIPRNETISEFTFI